MLWKQPDYGAPYNGKRLQQEKKDYESSSSIKWYGKPQAMTKLNADVATN